jgi:hypothetical protein
MMKAKPPLYLFQRKPPKAACGGNVFDRRICQKPVTLMLRFLDRNVNGVRDFPNRARFLAFTKIIENLKSNLFVLCFRRYGFGIIANVKENTVKRHGCFPFFAGCASFFVTTNTR